jgi:hypothetical protein
MAATWLTQLKHQWRSLAWRPWLDAFVQDHKVLRRDPRGFRTAMRRTCPPRTWIGNLARVVDAAGIERFPFVGSCWWFDRH